MMNFTLRVIHSVIVMNQSMLLTSGVLPQPVIKRMTVTTAITFAYLVNRFCMVKMLGLNIPISPMGGFYKKTPKIQYL